jgi:hypothetical protein
MMSEKFHYFLTGKILRGAQMEFSGRKKRKNISKIQIPSFLNQKSHTNPTKFTISDQLTSNWAIVTVSTLPQHSRNSSGNENTARTRAEIVFAAMAA